ncbi:MAG: HAD family hydrolase [Vulcanimicrobiaceae bacterium]
MTDVRDVLGRPPLEAVIFDLDDTLHDDTATYHRAAASVADDVARERGVAPSALLDAYVAQAERFWGGLNTATLATSLSDIRAKMWFAALASCGIRDEALAVRCGSAYNAYRRDLLELWPGARELLASLRARGYRLALITNGFSETHRDKIAVLGLEDAFDEIFIADEVGMVKPDARLFRLAAERLGVAPAACAMVGDRFDRDVRGGAAVGMFTVWMNVRDEPLPLDLRADAVVADLSGVEAALPLEGVSTLS